MLLRVEINIIDGGVAYGSLVFEDGSTYPVNMPASAYEDLCDRNFFQLPADLPPGEDECLNFSEIVESVSTVEANYMEASSGQRVF